MALTPGVYKALSRNGVHSVCACGFPMPKYAGRYPSVCPQCGASRTPAATPEAPAELPPADEGEPSVWDQLPE